MARIGSAPLRDALRRLRASRSAMASMALLALVTVACLIGPSFTGHAPDHVYRDYVRASPGLSARPDDAALPDAVAGIAARMRATASDIAVAGDTLRATLRGQRPLDPRLLAYFERSDLFGPAKLTGTEDDGRILRVEVPVERLRFLFGTDANGRDLLTRTLVAGRISLAIGLLASAVALVIGVIYGATAGYLGGRIDLVMMRVVDILYALPFIFFVILLVVFFGRHVVLIFLAVGAIEWLDMARIVRGQALALKRQDFVQAAEALGVSQSGILLRHIVPNTLGPVIVYVSLLVPKVILLESFLSFLGLGVQEPMASWGVLIADGSRAIEGAPWLLLFPAAFLVGTLFALNSLGDALRDALDPRER